jgi:hypothetical protein
MMDEQQLKISDLRKLLEKLEAEHGDLPCVLHDADTSWVWLMKASHVQVDGGRLRIGGDYGDEQEELA